MSVKRGLACVAGVKGVWGGGEKEKKEGAKKGEGVGLHSPPPPPSLLKRGFTVVTKSFFGRCKLTSCKEKVIWSPRLDLRLAMHLSYYC